MLLNIEHIGVSNPFVMGGAYTFPNTRVTLDRVVGQIDAGVPTETIFEDYPQIRGIRFNLLYVSQRLFRVFSQIDIDTQGVSSSGKYFSLKVTKFKDGDIVCTFLVEHYYSRDKFALTYSKGLVDREDLYTKEPVLYENPDEMIDFMLQESKRFISAIPNINITDEIL